MDDVTFLTKLISIPSPSGEEDSVAEYLVKQMLRLGFRARRDAAGNVIGTLGDDEADCTIMLLGHMDTVPGLIRVREESGKLYGRGAVDAKGPLAAFVLATAQLRSEIKEVRLVMVGVVGEESASPGAHHLAGTMAPPDGVIIGEPSGWQGITLGYKGALSIDYRLSQPASHSANGRSTPAEEAISFWNRLVEYTALFNQGKARRFDTLDPSLRAIHTFGDGREEGVKMRIGLRLPPNADVETLQRRMFDWCDGTELSFPYWEPPFQAEKNTLLVRALLRAIRGAGGQPRFKLKTGTSDMNVIGPAWGCPIVAYGPGDSTLDHTPDEHIDLAEFCHGVKVLTQALRIWMVEAQRPGRIPCR